MSQEKEVELAVRKAIAQEIITHREFLQSQFKHTIWVIGLVIASGAVIFTFLFGRTIDKTKEELTAQIENTVIEYRIAEDLKSRVNEYVNTAVRNNVSSDETQKKINDSVQAKLDTKFAELTNMVDDRTKSLAVTVKNDFKNDVNNLVQAALDDARGSSAKELLKSSTFPSGAILAFSLPDCPNGWSSFDEGAGRVIIGVGKGTGLTARNLMDKGGEEKHKLNIAEMPKHNHKLMDVRNDRRDDYGFGGSELNIYMAKGREISDIISQEGEGEPHNNMPPFIALRFCRKD